MALGSRDNNIYVYAVDDGGKKYSRIGRCHVSTSFIIQIIMILFTEGIFNFLDYPVRSHMDRWHSLYISLIGFETFWAYQFIGITYFGTVTSLTSDAIQTVPNKIMFWKWASS